MRHSLALASIAIAVLGCASHPRTFDESDAAEVTDASSVISPYEGGPASIVPDETYGPGVSARDAEIFKKPPGSAAPFVFDPSSGVVLPKGWSSPEFLVQTTSMPALVRLELTYDFGTTAYTAKPVAAPKADPMTAVTGAWWTVQHTKVVWEALKPSANAQLLKWRVLYASPNANAPDGASAGELTVLHEGVQPDVTYWEIANSKYSIRRLKVGTKGTQELVGAQTGCIGCHTVSPDGLDIAYQGGQSWDSVLIVRPTMNGAIPSPIVTPAANQLLSSNASVPTLSKGAWSSSTGYWIAFVEASPQSRLVLTEVDSPTPTRFVRQDSSGIGDVLPTWSPDGTQIVFVKTNHPDDGRGPDSDPGATCDLWRIPVSVSPGQAVLGAAQPVSNASGPDLEFYPSFSSDGKLLVFTKAPAGQDAYDEEQGNIYVMNENGATSPIRITANDAPKDPSVYAGSGLTNAWPRFGDHVITVADGSIYYPIVFNSRRGSPLLWKDWSGHANGRPLPRLVFAMIHVKLDGTIETTPGAIVPGQRVDAGNHTPDFRSLTSLPPPPPN